MERKVTPPEAVDRLYDYSGVVVFIFDSKGRILVTREKHSKETAYERGTPKKSDQLGIFTETREGAIGEHWVDTTLRGIKEEFGFTNDQIENLLKVDLSRSFIGETKFRDNCLASVLQLKCSNSEQFLNTVVPNTEIDVIGWLSPDFFLKASGNIRFGVKKVLGDIADFSDRSAVFGNFDGNMLPLTRPNLQKVYSNEL